MSEELNESIVNRRLKIGVLILNALVKKQFASQDAAPYFDFKVYLRNQVSKNILFINYLNVETVKQILNKVKEFSIELSEAGLIVFNPENDSLALTPEGMELAVEFQAKVETSTNHYEASELTIASKVLADADIKFNAIKKTNELNKSNLMPAISNQHFALLQNLLGERFVIVFGLGIFQLDDYNESYRPGLIEIQTIAD